MNIEDAVPEEHEHTTQLSRENGGENLPRT
ncbi:Uncharacterised protein [Yersinia pekkanenii]|uniref:Uncharacterized protein n=1 Tax=Yersinia pekkanenii TaxID=1288385 RepID=A0A0T9R3I3_9GAMM|nr:Uncharacterised protein [Yersinia pekkanenii]